MFHASKINPSVFGSSKMVQVATNMLTICAEELNAAMKENCHNGHLSHYESDRYKAASAGLLSAVEEFNRACRWANLGEPVREGA